MIELRDYQKQAVMSIINDWRQGLNGYANIITGGGKSIVIAELIRRCLLQNYRVLNLVPTMELCKQNYDEIVGYIGSTDNVGVVCAALNKKQGHRQVVVAMTDSYLNNRFKFGAFDVVLIDECDLVSYNPDSKYQRIISAFVQLNSRVKFAGFTGSPYRMGTGVIENPHHEYGRSLFDKRSFCTDSIIPSMIECGYLSRIESISGDIQADLTDVKLNSLGDYNTELMAVKFDIIIPHAVRDMVVKINAYDISTALIFASNIANATKIMDEYKYATGLDNIRMVTGEAAKKHDRKKNIEWFEQSPGQRIIVNVGILTRGYNFRALGCIVFMRSTMSLNLYVQIMGRLIRAHNEKECGYAIDYGGNIERHGAIDAIKPPQPKTKDGKANKKECLMVSTIVATRMINGDDYTLMPGFKCGYMNHNSAKACALCDAEFIPDQDAMGGYSMRSHAEALKANETKKHKDYEITGVWFDRQTSKSGEMMLVVKYYSGETVAHRQFLCLNHSGYARHEAVKFLKFWAKNPMDIDELYSAGELNSEAMLSIMDDEVMLNTYFKAVKSITLKNKKDSKYKDLIKVEFK